MAKIGEWSTTAADNGSTLGSTPDYWPEGQAPSTVNNCARELMAQVRAQWNDAQWFDWGYTPSYVSGTSFTVVTATGGWNTVTLPAAFEVDSRLKIITNGSTTIYGTVSLVSASAASTQVTFSPDSGNLSTTVNRVFNSIITPSNVSIPPGISGGGGGGGSVTHDVTQGTHGLTAGKWIYLDGSDYKLADLTAATTAESVGIVVPSPAPTTNTFTFQMAGRVTGLSGLTVGGVYYLDTNGDMTLTPSTTSGYINKPLMVADTTTSGIIIPYRGNIIGASGGSGGSGKVVQIVSSTDNTGSSTSSTSFVDVSGSSLSITPTSVNNKILVMYTTASKVNIHSSSNTVVDYKVLRDATQLGNTWRFGAAVSAQPAETNGSTAFSYVDDPGTTSSITYKMQQKRSGGSVVVSTSNVFVTLMEVDES